MVATASNDDDITRQLVSMGFSAVNVERAISQNRAFSQQNQSHYIQRLVTWLINHPSSDDSEDNGGTTLSEDDDEEMTGNNDQQVTKDVCDVIIYFILLYFILFQRSSSLRFRRPIQKVKSFRSILTASQIHQPANHSANSYAMSSADMPIPPMS